MKQGITTLIGRGWSYEIALQNATAQANEWMQRHNWIDTGGKPAYHVYTDKWEDDRAFVYALIIVGRLEERP